jgi:hypothetical protein
MSYKQGTVELITPISFSDTSYKISEQNESVHEKIAKVFNKELLPIEKIYPDKIPGEIGTVVELLTKSSSLLNEAIINFDESLVNSDECVQQFLFLLPDLFYFRKIGEGFGIIISSLLIALTNRGGIPLEKKQLILVNKIIGKLKNEPFFGTLEAVQYCDEMEDNGLNLSNITNNINAVIDDFLS